MVENTPAQQAVDFGFIACRPSIRVTKYDRQTRHGTETFFYDV